MSSFTDTELKAMEFAEGVVISSEVVGGAVEFTATLAGAWVPNWSGSSFGIGRGASVVEALRALVTLPWVTVSDGREAWVARNCELVTMRGEYLVWQEIRPNPVTNTQRVFLSCGCDEVTFSFPSLQSACAYAELLDGSTPADLYR